MEEGTKDGRQDLVAGGEKALRRETPEVRLVGDVATLVSSLGPQARAMLDALPRFAVAGGKS